MFLVSYPVLCSLSVKGDFGSLYWGSYPAGSSVLLEGTGKKSRDTGICWNCFIIRLRLASTRVVSFTEWTMLHCIAIYARSAATDVELDLVSICLPKVLILFQIGMF